MTSGWKIIRGSATSSVSSWIPWFRPRMFCTNLARQLFSRDGGAKRVTMVGLSASELQAETLFPGDTVEYYSMAFVAGDPRGHRVSKVLRIDRQDDEFPIRVDTEEMLPLTIMLKRNRDRNDVEISSNGETTSCQRSSIEKISTPERKKKKRKPLTPRENTEHYSSSRSHDKVVLKKSRDVEKFSRKSRPEDDKTRPEQKFKYDKHESRKRKRSDSTLKKKTRPIDTTPKKNQERISRFFGAEQKQRQPKKKSGIDLKRFMNHAEEKYDIKAIENKKRTVWGLDEYFELDEKKKELEAEKSTGAGTNPCDKSGNKEWGEQRSNYRKNNAGPSGPLQSWLSKGKRKDELEIISSGTPTKPQRPKQRTLNLVPDKQRSPRMDRKNLSFVLSNSSSDAAYWKEAKHSKNRDDSASNEHVQLRRKRGSLGTVSARVR
ncbi:uncharacterized protein PITG_14977 [Phytophthora infestans T30-4]|uniref:Uncharacterized protein n=1 Tax=Phytophthora infestans (strain T30-4) TaxID=403677 RepID=D0NPG5_PHYIT|nr:uncharacterized protein PITG_14977 [Phytophthora infestans T30-4]EEY62507.1 conserved hypothetical protein [Phytophthora infestans T30-4]|eukprot:XP_002899143.1 conserved hypothetical protein [Phytophthora infestans T30-4]